MQAHEVPEHLLPRSKGSDAPGSQPFQAPLVDIHGNLVHAGAQEFVDLLHLAGQLIHI